MEEGGWNDMKGGKAMKNLNGTATLRLAALVAGLLPGAAGRAGVCLELYKGYEYPGGGKRIAGNCDRQRPCLVHEQLRRTVQFEPVRL
jgi:hypothetical protein